MQGEHKGGAPYYRYAFHNAYNYASLGGLGAAALLTGNWWLIVAGLGAEALWMVFAPDSKLLQRLWFDKAHAAHEHDLARTALAKKLDTLPGRDSERVLRLEAKRNEIFRLVGENQAFGARLMQPELDKLERLVRDYTDLALSAWRHRVYLDAVNLKELLDELTRYEAAVQREKDVERRSLAQKNLEVLLRRRDKLAEINGFAERARQQMSLIENTFDLLADQIITMRSPSELDGRLDDLIEGVEAVRGAAREAEAMMADART